MNVLSNQLIRYMNPVLMLPSTFIMVGFLFTSYLTTDFPNLAPPCDKAILKRENEQVPNFASVKISLMPVQPFLYPPPAAYHYWHN